ncbi:MAG: cysteine desulfurase [Deltaproteobacteria bacterium]|nr:cysteine desulfurase [Deltaproteobacteria bacterium]
MIDFDHNATTPVDARVRAAMADLLARDDLGNPSSRHRRGQAARDVVEGARRQVAAALEAEPLGVTFTSGGTEADNLAILGAARALRAAGRPHGVLTSPLEHPAVVAAARCLEAEGHPIAWVPVDAQGRIEPGRVGTQVAQHPEVGLVSLAAANHELGNAYDIPGIVEAVREAREGVLVHVDAVQAVGRRPVSLGAWGVDLLSVSGHKLGGPAGVGALVHTRGLKLAPLRHGGGQERGRRVGTEPWLLIQGFGLAVALAASEQPQRFAAMSVLRARLAAGLREQGAQIHGDPEHHTGNTLNAAFEGCEGELVMMNLDLAGFAVSTGAACSAGVAGPSPVIEALGLPPGRAAGALRLSLGVDTTAADVDGLLAELRTVVPRVREAARHRSAS